MTLDSLIAFVRHEQHQRMLAEGAALFWALAELLLLYGVLVGRRYVETRPFSATLALTRRERRRAALWLIGFAAAALAVYGRHFVGTPLALDIESAARGAISASRLQEAYTSAARNHMRIWAGFVMVWVALECCIVYHGWRAYRTLREALRE